jgi:hypothetical protein
VHGVRKIMDLPLVSYKSKDGISVWKNQSPIG